MTLEIIEEGLHTTIQDKGRIGYQSYGFSVSGAMDEYAATMANLVVGNHKDAAGIEMSFIGPTVSFDQDTIIAITGADMTANISEQVIPLGKAIQINKGDILQFRTAKSGLYGYLAVKGGLDLPEILGSSSTVARAGIKGILGRKLTIGDQLPICQSHSIKQSINWRLPPALFDYINQNSVMIRYIEGPQYDWFNKSTFEQTEWEISTQSNRMGYRLNGKQVKRKEDKQLLTEATTFGSIQIPPNGLPIILMADGQPTGGYPKIGQVAKVDLSKLSQIRPGRVFRFQKITVEEAIHLLEERIHFYRQMKYVMKENWEGVTL